MQFVDALRGIAAVWVLIHHFRHNGRFEASFDNLFGGTLPSVIDKFFACGSAGVEVFFVLSGFVIAHCVYRRSVPFIGVFNFSGRRLTRLALPYWGALFFALLLILLQPVIGAQESNKSIGLGVIISNITLTYPYVGSPSYLPVAWTLIVEVQFYLFFILLAFLAGKCTWQSYQPTKILIGLAFLTGMASAAWSIMKGYHAFNSHIFSYWIFFVLGAFCYWYERKEIHLWACLLVIASVGTLALYLWSPRMVIGVLAGGCLVAAIYLGGVKNWLSGPIFQYFGSRSYSIYLIHFPILTTCNMWFFQTGKESVYMYIAAQLAATTLALLLSEISYRFVERPAIKLSHKFAGLKRLHTP